MSFAAQFRGLASRLGPGLRQGGLLVVLFASSCGWHAGLTAPGGAETLAIRFLGNDGPLRDLEVDLTQAIAEAAIDRLSLVPAEPDHADLVVQGRILDYRRRPGIRSPENTLLETASGVVLET